MNKSLTTLCSIFLLFFINTGMGLAQTQFFKKASQKELPKAVGVINNINHTSVFSLDETALRKYLLDAPLESKNGAPIPLEIPLPNGKVEVFKMMESPILSSEIAAQYPEIKTYTGNGTVDKKRIVRLSLTSSGFNAIILNVDGDAVYFQSYTKKHSKYYFNYFAKNATLSEEEIGENRCGVGIDAHEKNEIKIPSDKLKNMTGGQLRTYRLTMTANGEFTVRHGGTQASAFNVIVAYVNRMNAVYRNELSVHFNLVSGTNLVFTDPATDGFTNSNEITMLGENQTRVDAVIGSANYDVGHIMGTTGGSGAGVASSPSVCTSFKAEGASKEGDINTFAQVFFDQLLFHEVGHQFDMNHSYNSVIPVCTTRNPGTSVEPGAGATIMSYGFTCDSDDYFSSTQTGPILKFHTISYSEAAAYILAGGNCATSTSTGNTPPVVTMPSNITIPKSTPFSLTGSATDANGDNLTYDWEGTDTGAGTPDASTLMDTAEPPFFRSYEISSSPTRTYPIIGAILDGSNMAKGDKLPSVGIATNHRFIVRDNNAAGGGLTFGSMTVTTDNGSGPFLMTSQNATIAWMIGSTKTINWDVANTNNSPINCNNVDILLSTDGGLTFPTTLASNTPNDGTHNIVVPNTSTSSARIKVVCSSSIFFDVNNANIVINATGTFTCDDTAIALTCGEDYDGDTNAGTNNFGSYSCQTWDESGKEVIHKITTTATGNITATISNLNQDLDVFILTDCSDANSCVAGADVTATATNQPAGTYYIVVDGYEGAVSTYTLNVSSTAACDAGVDPCNTPPPASGTIAGGTYQVSGSMSTGGQVLSGSNVMLKAGTSITLGENFHAENGSIFRAYITPCSSSAQEDEIEARTVVTQSSLSIFPNPTSDFAQVQFSLEQAERVQVYLFDQNGRKIRTLLDGTRTVGEHQLELRTGSLSKGIYFISVITDSKRMIEKVIIQ